MRRALAFVHGLAVDVHRGTDVRVAHEFLLHFHRSPRLIEQGPECVAERVPAVRSPHHSSVDARFRYSTKTYRPSANQKRAKPSVLVSNSFRQLPFSETNSFTSSKPIRIFTATDCRTKSTFVQWDLAPWCS